MIWKEINESVSISFLVCFDKPQSFYKSHERFKIPLLEENSGYYWETQ